MHPPQRNTKNQANNTNGNTARRKSEVIGTIYAFAEKHARTTNLGPIANSSEAKAPTAGMDGPARTSKACVFTTTPNPVANTCIWIFTPLTDQLIFGGDVVVAWGEARFDGCSFTQTADPVVAADGDSYERDALDAYFTACKRGKRIIVSPRTGEPMDAMMMPNRA